MLRGTAREAAAEFLGTAVLIAFGSAVVAQVVLSGQSHGGYLSINIAWGLAVTMGVYVAGGVSGAHLNPAVTLASAVHRGFAWSKVNITELSSAVGLVNTVIGNTNQIVHQLFEQRATPFPVLITLFRRGNGMILVSLRSRNGEALKVAEKLQGGGHANACGAMLPRSVQNIPDAITYLRQILNPAPARGSPLNNLESLFDAIELGKK